MNRTLKSLALASSAVVLAPGASGANANPSECVVKSRSEGVVLMHCKTNLEDKAWVEAAKAACQPGKACNVWIWDDLARMPTTAPKTDAELPKSATGAAVAVWINDSGSLMKLKKVK
jgi:hypothetical protein